MRRSLLLGVLLAAACSTPPAPRAAVSGAQEEREHVLSLLACSVVAKGWQSVDAPAPRGHNIGAVLLNPEGRLVGWGRNCNAITRDPTQHAEVRAMRDFLAREKTVTLKDYEVHTTLEPCAMCAAMMAMAGVRRAVYVQSDPAFGRAAERLALDSTRLPGGYPPYPRILESRPSAGPIQKLVDARFAEEHAVDKPITDWLRSASARKIFEEAAASLRAFAPRFPENTELLRDALRLLEAVPADYAPFRNN